METPGELSFISALLPLAIVVFIIAFGVVLLNLNFHKNLIRQKVKQEETKTRYQQELLKSSIHIQEEERKRIARDLHDEMGAVLSLARMYLAQLQDETKGVAQGEAVQKIQNLVENSISSIRRISHELMPPELETFGLARVLESLASQASQNTSVTIHFHEPDHMPRMPWHMEVGLYRVVMELISNTLKHAGATEINIALAFEANALRLSYSDDGKGLNFGGMETPSGLGLKNMEARVTTLGGTFSLKNGEVCGVQASVFLPNVF